MWQTGLNWKAILNAVAVRMVASGQTVPQSRMNFDGVAPVAFRS
jgi:hypothetical protein